MAISVTIAGVSKPPTPRSIRLSLMAGGRGTHSMTVVSEDGTYVPAIGQEVAVLDGATKIWSGSIDAFDRQSVPNTLDPQQYGIECVTWEQRLDRRRCKHHNTGAVAVYTRNFEFTADDSTDVITATGHGRSNGAVVRVKSSGTLPAGLAANTDYYVRDVSGATLKLALTAGGSAIDITDAGTGTHVLMTMRAGECVSDLLTNFADDEGITEADIDLGAVVDKAVFDAESSVWEAIESLATASQYIAYVDVDKGLHFCSREVTAAPFNITNANRAKLRSLMVHYDRADKCNTAMARTAWAAWSIKEETFAGDDTTTDWTLAGRVAQIEYVRIDDGAAVTEKSFGQYLIDSDRDYYYRFAETAFSGTAVASGSDLIVGYRELGTDTVVSEDSTNVTNTAAAEGGSGRYERFYDRSSQLGAVQVLAEMDALVAVLKNTGTEVIYEIDTVSFADAPLLRPGMLQGVTVGEYDLADDFLIDQIDVTDDSDGNYLTYRVRAISGAQMSWIDFYKALAGRASGGSMTGASGGTGGGGAPGVLPDPPDNFATCTVDVDTTGEKVKLTITPTEITPPVNGRPTKAHPWGEIPDRSAGTPIILDGSYKLGDGGKLGGRVRPIDWGSRDWDGDNPTPIVVEVDHVTESTPCRVWLVSAIEGAENELSTSISATFTIDPPGVNKPASGTAYGPNPSSITAGTVTRDDDTGVDVSYIPVTVTGVPTEAPNFLGYEILSGWPDGYISQPHTGIETTEGLLPQEIEIDTPASVVSVILYVRSCFQGPNGAINKNPIVPGVTPPCTVTIGTTSGTVDGGAIKNATITAGKLGIASITGDVIASATITGTQIANATITASNIANATITATQIANATITADQIAAATITANEIAAASITGNEIAAAAIAAAHIGAGVITAHEIAAATIVGANIAAGAIAGAHIGAGAVTGSNIAAATVSGANLAAGTITAANIESLTITAAQIADLTINGQKITAGAITGGVGGKIDNRTITAINIATGAITATEIANATITALQIANATITGDKIANAQITSAHIQNATITGADIAASTITADNILNATITGQKIANATITGAQIASAQITGSHIQAGVITASHIQALTITANEIASLTITGNKIANLTITAAQIQDASITSAKIASLSADKITAGTISASISMTSPTITSTNAGNVASLRDGYVESISPAYKAQLLGGNLTFTSIAAGQPLSQHTSTSSAWLDGYGFTLASVSGTTGLRVNASGGVNRVSITASAANFSACPIQVSGVTVVDTDRSLRNISDLSMTGWLYIDGVPVLTGRQAGVADPIGGGTVDTEARAAIAAIIDRLQALGVIS